MRRPSGGQAIGIAGVAAVPVAAAGLAAVIGQQELTGHPHADIWSNVWYQVAAGLAGLGMLVAVVFSVLALTGGANSPDGVTEAQPDDPADSDEVGSLTAVAMVADARHAYASPGPVRTRRASPPPRPARSVPAAAPACRPAGDTGVPVIAERLELTLAGERIRSTRTTPGRPNDQAQLVLPADRMMEDYRRALVAAAALSGPPDAVTAAWLRELVQPLQRALVQAIPEPTRQRMVTEGGAAKLAAIELTLTSSQLDKFPWELIADPAVLSPGTVRAAVWRTVLAPADPPVCKGWTSNLLLTRTATVPDELAQVKGELTGCGRVEVFDHPGIPLSLGPLLAEHPPAAFHLAAHAAGTGGGPTLLDLKVSAEDLGDGLGRHGAWVAVFSCRDSAAAPADGSRPPACEIAERSGAAVIGMAGPTQPAMGAVFAITFYRCLARGFSAVQAYDEAVRAVRGHDVYSTMWSIPVMYARNSNVIPFPADDQSRTRVGLEEVRYHVTALDRELENLAGGDVHSRPGWWADQAAIPIVRTGCITQYLEAAIPGRPAAGTGENRQGDLAHARDQLQAALSDTADSLSQLSAGEEECRRALQKLPRHRKQQQRYFSKINGLIAEVC
jgi:hypothetical protein